MSKKIKDPEVFDVKSYERQATKGPQKRKSGIADNPQLQFPWWHKKQLKNGNNSNSKSS